MVTALVTPTTRDTGFSKIHDVESVSRVLFTAFHSEVEPLLMAPGVSIHLHEQVISVLLCHTRLRIQ